MKAFAPKISLFLWSLWTFQGLLMLIRQQLAVEWPEGWNDFYYWQITVRIQACGITLSLLLWKTRLRIFALLLVPVSFWAFWNSFLGFVAFKMLSGVRINNALTEWWHLGGAFPWILVNQVPYVLFTFASLFFWPIYSLGLVSAKGAKSNAPWV